MNQRDANDKSKKGSEKVQVVRQASNRQQTPQRQTQTAPRPKKSTKEYLFKVLVIGDLNAGKTSLIKRYTQHTFSEQYRTTIGVDFALKVVDYDASSVVRLQLWDIAGQEKSGNMTRVYYKDAVACVIVYDVNSDTSFQASERWKNDLDEKLMLPDGDKVPCLLFGNKKDLDNESEPAHPDMKEYCRAKKYVGWFEGSAKHNINVDEAFFFILSRIMMKNKEMNLGMQNIAETQTLSNLRRKSNKSSSCCITRKNE